MSNRAHRARRDTSEAEVIHALEALGWKVKKLAQKGVPDLLVWGRPGSRDTVRRIVLVECKTGKGKLRETQQWDDLGLDVEIFRCAEDVFSWHMGRKVTIAK
jgi:hypothetical protein